MLAPQSKQGFTILEVLVASVLVGVAIFSIFEIFNRGFFGVGEVENYSTALSLTQKTMEELKDWSYSSLATQAKASLASPYNKFQQSTTVTTTSSMKQVVVTTYWNVPGGETSASLTTYMANLS